MKMNDTFTPATGHGHATRMFTAALTLHESAGWQAASAVWEVRLAPSERAWLAVAALASLDDADALEAVDTALGGAGSPLPALFSFADEAAFWADMATPGERHAYLGAILARLTTSERQKLAKALRRAAA